MWYETPDNLFFSQHTLHRTDERTQINNDLGWRHFTPTWMSGINLLFYDDLLLPLLPVLALARSTGATI
ncbi:inverse autotransporter beta domain-containing protein [Escherichia coli]